MQERVLHVLEFNKIRELLKEHASSSLGKEKALKLMPSGDINEVLKRQEQTDEALTVLRLKGSAPFGGLSDIRPSVKRAQIGGTLGPQELVAVSAVLYASRQMKQFIEKLTQEEEVSLPHLEQLVSEIGIYLKEEKEIQRCIRDDGEIVDDASDKLKAIRGQIRTLEARIREKLESIIRSPSAQKIFRMPLLRFEMTAIAFLSNKNIEEFTEESSMINLPQEQLCLLSRRLS